ncbi:ADOP family duplicated permease [Frateuria soli]|uniref:ADOP family duplicated permease n=1 Tax=Frateuria soli TaxID=1542730 RepID=UPI001E574421|nr:ADOP family duplicated permease [Frateuria soli]UGB38550.1 ADOP family duplicated permease [Frateuria soli]
MNVWLAEIWRTWRASLRRPGFLLLAVAVLALGVGASTSVFVLVDNVLLRPLPYPDAGRLMVLGPEQHGELQAILSPQQYQHVQSIPGIAGIGLIKGDLQAVNVAGDGEPEQVDAFLADRSVLPVLGVRMRLGRGFSAEEDRPGGPKAVILAEGFWRRRYGGQPVLGRTLRVEGVARTIVGVLPASFDQFGAGDIMLPLALPPHTYDDGADFFAIARLAPGSSVAAVNARVDAAIRAMYADLPGAQRDYLETVHVGSVPLAAALHQQQRPAMRLFLACAVCVLLIALVNLGNLMLLRTLSRRHDAIVRHALGAPGWRLALPACAEGLLVGASGAIAGLGLAAIGLSLFGRYVPVEWTHGRSLHVHGEAALLALAIAVPGALAAALFGAWRGLAASSVREALHEGGRSLGSHSGRVGKALVIAQMALATCLMCGAGLFLHALYDAARAPLGFAGDHVLTFDLAPVRGEHPDAASTREFVQELLRSLRALPGVEGVAATNGLPAGGFEQQFNMGGIHLPGSDYLRPSPQIRAVSSDYFSVFRIPVHEGRAFDASDVSGGDPVAIVNQTLAEQEYGDHAVGKQIVVNDYSGYAAGKATADRPDMRPVTARIVGVVGDTRQFGPLDGRKRGFLYLPVGQVPEHILRVFRSYHPLRFALRVQGDPNDYRRAVHAAVAAVAPDQPIASVSTMDDVVRATTGDTRRDLFLIGLFALLALGLAAAGMYAVMTVAVTARQREFGVRMALGAPPARMARLVLRGGAGQIAIGMLLGVAITLALSRVLGAVLEDIGRTVMDPLALAGVCVVLAMAGLLACLLPALRAARVPPMHALRGE